MKIIFYPIGMGAELPPIVKQGDVLLLGGEAFDFSLMPPDSTLPHGAVDSTWFNGTVEREGSELIIGLLLPLPDWTQPADWETKVQKNVPDGVIALPALTLELQGEDDGEH